MSAQHAPIAVIGTSALFPGSQDASGFWRDILAGRDLLTDVPPSHWLIEDYYDPDPHAPDKTYAKRGGFLSPTPFDPLEYGIPPALLEATDSSQLLSIIVAKRLLDDAYGERWGSIDRDRISVVLGVTSGQQLMHTMGNRIQRPIWEKAMRDQGLDDAKIRDVADAIADHYVPWQEASFPGLLGNVVAGRIANRFDLHGTNCVTDAACASSLAAIAMAMDELRLGRADMVITGGVDTFNDIFMYMCFSKTPALSAAGDCRPFSAAGDGTMLGEGLAMFALKRLDDAERDGDHVYAVIKGMGSSSDGRAKSIYAPVSAGQAMALKRAWQSADFDPRTIELIEAHGTGTIAGDAAEVRGLQLALGEEHAEATPWVALGSVKAQIGHTKAAAGAAGLFKAVMALHHKVLPPTAKIDLPNPAIPHTTGPLYLNTKARPWVRGADHPRRAGLSSFGFGGSNFHAAIEEYTGANPAPRTRAWPVEAFMVGADSLELLGDAVHALIRDAARPDGFVHAARTSQLAMRADAAWRLCMVAEDADTLRKKLTQAMDALRARPDEPGAMPAGVFAGRGAPAGAVALLFPGQGSQYLDMGADLAMHVPAARAQWDAEAARGLHHTVFPRHAFEAAEQEAQRGALRATQTAQPAIGLTSLATLGILRELGVTPAMCAGHSFGEVIALHAAGALDAATTMEVAAMRGARMAEAAASCPPGAMLAVSASKDELEPLLAQWELPIVLANHNNPRQIVLSGPASAIDDAAARLADARISARKLDVATAFHSPLVAEATGPFTEALEGLDWQTPGVPVFANATAQPYPTDPAAIAAQLGGQIAQPVRFVEQIEAMWEAGARVFIEVGPNDVLTRLVGRILTDRPHQAVATDSPSRHGLTSLAHAIAQLTALGVPLRLESLWSGQRVVAPKPPSDKKPRPVVPISGTNHNKPYPLPSDVGHTTRPRPTPAPAPIAAQPAPQPVQARPAPQAPAAPVTKPIAAPQAAQPIITKTKTMSDDQRPLRPQHAPATAQPADASWVAAFQESQRQMVDAHSMFQQALLEGHRAFLHAVEHSQSNLVAALQGGAPINIAAPAPQAVFTQPAPRPQIAAPVVAAPPVAAPAPIAAPIAPPAPRPAPVAAAPAPVKPAPAPVVKAAPVAPVAAPVAPSATNDLNQTLMEVVAAKTGYPADMLELGMELEADLGIDSIKRVEILSALKERVPGLPDLDASRMASLTTLGAVLSHLEQRPGFF
jgi:polyketide-type polyunsaturated fatty acid synthase PfaA